MKYPKPETLTAILPSFGYGPGRPHWTEHKYVETRECTLPSPDGAAYEFIFVCTETNIERRWGTEGREEVS